jgi:cell fate regulator YaaT (PSP1 superfamily)
MENTPDKLPVVVGIRFSPIGKSYYFDASAIEDVQLGYYFIVETSRGWQLGQLVQIVEDRAVRKKMRYKPVDRLATSEDLKKKEILDAKASEALEISHEIMITKKIKGVKVISAEFSFDEKILSFLYSTENEKQINFNSIIREIKEKYQVKKIEFHKIGPRDVAKYYSGMGACGLETRCCARFLNRFESISIRMAKAQRISLTPSDITGMCDRLRCCLSYEYCNYVEALKDLPKRNKRVNTPLGVGKVKDVAPLRKTVFVALDDHGIKEFDIKEIEVIESNQESRKLNRGPNRKHHTSGHKNQKNQSSKRRRKTNPNQNSRKE